MMYQVSDNISKRFANLVALPQVQQALAFVEHDQERCIAQQCELVQIEAPTGQEGKRAAAFVDMLRACGIRDAKIDPAGNVVAIRHGKGNGPKVLVEGHLDTVFPLGSVHGVEKRDGFLCAPGIGDDTRALAMLLSLLRAMDAAGIETCGDIYFVGTTREEGMGSLGGMKDFLTEHTDIDVSISVDGHNMAGIVYQATIGETWEISFSGVGGHAFNAFGKIAQPLHAAARAVAKIADITVPSTPRTSFCVSNFHGGNDAGIHAIASEATIKINFRSDGEAEFAAVKKAIFEAIDAACAEETARWGKNTVVCSKHMVSSIPGGTQDCHAPLVEAAWLGLQYLGVEPELAASGCTNANVAIAKGIPAICIGRAYAPDDAAKITYTHSLDERYPVEGAYKAVQQTLLILLMAAGMDTVEPIVR